MKKTTKRTAKHADGFILWYWIIEAVKAISKPKKPGGGNSCGCNAVSAALAVIYSFCKGGNARRISAGYIADCIRCRREYVLTIIETLESAGYIRIERAHKSAHTYRITRKLEAIRKADASGGAFLYVKPWMLETCGGFNVSCALLAFCASCSNQSGEPDARGAVFGSHMDFAKRFGCGRRTIYKAFARLYGMGYISSLAERYTTFEGAERDIVRGAESSQDDTAGGAESSQDGGAQSSQGGAQSSQDGGAQSSHNDILYEINNDILSDIRAARAFAPAELSTPAADDSEPNPEPIPEPAKSNDLRGAILAEFKEIGMQEHKALEALWSIETDDATKLRKAADAVIEAYRKANCKKGG